MKGGIFKKGTLNLQDLINQVKQNMNLDKSGAIFTFTGITRNTSRVSKKKVEKIVIEAWEEKAVSSLNEIALDIQNKLQLIDVRVFHGVGEFNLGEEMVYIVVASTHREAGLQAIGDLIHQYKTVSPIWKKEIYTDGTSDWISGKGQETPELKTQGLGA